MGLINNIIMNIKQINRKKILLNIDKKLLQKLTNYCNKRKIIRNKYIERIIREKIENGIKPNRNKNNMEDARTN